MTNKKEKMWDIKDRNESPRGRRQNMSEEEIKARENKSLEIKIKIEKELENPNKSKVYAVYDDKDGKVKVKMRK
jgi:hypothetical protein